MGIKSIPLPGEAVVPTLPGTSADNVIEFTPSNLSFTSPATAAPQGAESFGTETSAISADLLFLDENEIPSISWETPVKPR
jgi:hypothetical protein